MPSKRDYYCSTDSVSKDLSPVIITPVPERTVAMCLEVFNNGNRTACSMAKSVIIKDSLGQLKITFISANGSYKKMFNVSKPKAGCSI